MTAPGAGWSYRLTPNLILCDREPPLGPEDEVRRLVIHSGDAFPLGHPTTRLCLDLLCDTLAAAPVRTCLDVGCGVGVLSLAAALLGVPRVVAVDIAFPAADITRANARTHGLEAALQVVQGSSDCVHGPFELVAANLPWEVQRDKLPEFVRLAAPGGRLLLSGFRDHQEAPLLASYRTLGWSLAQRHLKPFSHPELPPAYSFTWVAWLLTRT